MHTLYNGSWLHYVRAQQFPIYDIVVKETVIVL